MNEEPGNFWWGVLMGTILVVPFWLFVAWLIWG